MDGSGGIGAGGTGDVRKKRVRGGGAVDRNRVNDRQRVLVLDTGDRYFF